MKIYTTIISCLITAYALIYHPFWAIWLGYFNLTLAIIAVLISLVAANAYFNED